MAVIDNPIPKQAADIEKTKRLAQLLMQNSQRGQDPYAQTGGPYSRVIPIHPLAAALQGLQAGFGAYYANQADEQKAELEQQKLNAVRDAFSGGQLDMEKAAGSGAFDPETLAKLLVGQQDKQQQFELQKQLADYKNQAPTTGQRDALWAAGGDENQARQLLQNKIQNPLGMLNYQLQAGNMAADNNRQEQALNLQKQEFDFRRQQAEQAATRAEKAAQLSQLQNVPPQHRMAYAENQTALNKIDNAIELIKQNPDALGYKNVLGDNISQRLDEKGVPVRAAVAEIGGVKLHDLSGAAVSPTESKRLMPLIPQATDTPEAAIKKLEALRNEYAGINGQLESMYDSEDYKNPIVSAMPKSEGNLNVDIKPEAWQSMTPSQRKQLITEMKGVKSDAAAGQSGADEFSKRAEDFGKGKAKTNQPWGKNGGYGGIKFMGFE